MYECTESHFLQMVLANSLLHATSKFKKLLPYLTFFIVTKVKKVILINDNTLTFEVIQYSEMHKNTSP